MRTAQVVRRLRSARHVAAFLFVALAQAALARESAIAADAERDRPVTTVDSVDLARYAGLWHEIARVPNPFQRKCLRGTTAEYTLREDGRIDVVNRCFEKDDKPSEAKGVAKVVEGAHNAKLRVSFVSFLGWRPFWGDYWVLGLDEGYQWVAIGTPNRK